MAADFVPFLPGLRARLPQDAPPLSPGGFTPVTQPCSSNALVSQEPCKEVKLEFKREGDRIQEIRIHCKCGEVIELLCDY